MEALPAQDVRRFVEFAHEAARVARAEPRRFYRWTIEAIAELVPSDAVWFGESNRGLLEPASRANLLRIRADDRQIEAYRNRPDVIAAWNKRLAYEHPLTAQRLRRPFELCTLRLSDFTTTTHFRRLEAYNLLLRPFGLQQTISVGYRSPCGLNEIICARTRLEFSDRDVMLLDLAATAIGLAARDPQPTVPPPLALTLTTREAQVLARVARGYSNAETAEALSVSPGTIKKHLDNIFTKLGVRNRVQATHAWREAQHRPPG